MPLVAVRHSRAHLAVTAHGLGRRDFEPGFVSPFESSFFQSFLRVLETFQAVLLFLARLRLA